MDRHPGHRREVPMARRFIVQTDAPELGPYVVVELVGWVAGHVERDFDLWSEDELELMLPDVLEAWRRRDDWVAELSETFIPHE
jgi:hypothetical protein